MFVKSLFALSDGSAMSHGFVHARTVHVSAHVASIIMSPIAPPLHTLKRAIPVASIQQPYKVGVYCQVGVRLAVSICFLIVDWCPVYTKDNRRCALVLRNTWLALALAITMLVTSCTRSCMRITPSLRGCLRVATDSTYLCTIR